MTDTEILDFITNTGSSLVRGEFNDVNQWLVIHPLIATSKQIRANSPRKAVEETRRRIVELSVEMSK